MSDISLFTAFFAGLISFLSPCVLPLVPPYLCYLAGTSLDELTSEDASANMIRRRAIITALFFVAGFSTVFVALGAGASSIGMLLRSYLDILSMIAGIIIIIMGLHFLGVFKIALLYREKRFEGPQQANNPAMAYIMGLAFAFGWTPCIGPVLGVILSIAASSEQISNGALLLAVYAAGIGVPFIAAAFAIRPFLNFFQKFRSYFSIIEKVMGSFLIIAGILFLTGDMQRFSFWLLETFPILGTIG